MTQLHSEHGYAIVSCPACGAWPLRYTPGELGMTDYNWLRRCLKCGRPVCRLCMPEDHNRCTKQLSCSEYAEWHPGERFEFALSESTLTKYKREHPDGKRRH